MKWYPLGPRFVFEPRNPNYLRLSRRNELGSQGMTFAIVIDPTSPSTIYTIDRGAWAGRGVFRTRDRGRSWDSVLDSLLETDPQAVPECLAINPAHPETLYLGTVDTKGIFVSHDRGDSWQRTGYAGGVNVHSLAVDPRSAGNLASTILFAGTSNGVHVSRDGGATWTQATGPSSGVFSLLIQVPQQGAALIYAGASGQGVFRHADDADLIAGWTNLNEQGIGLPRRADLDFDHILIADCARKPERLYALHFYQGGTAKLCTTAAATTSWTEAAPAANVPSGGYYTWGFWVAPNSPGDGKNDILFANPRRMARSIDSGNTWTYPSGETWFHEDGHAVAFHTPGNQTIPHTYHGCDGGIGVSTRLADPTYDITQKVDYNELLRYDPADGGVQGLNHGRLASLAHTFASHRDLPSIGYISAQDTGCAGGDGPVWRVPHHADTGSVICAPGEDGVKVWIGQQVPSFLYLATDKGELGYGLVNVSLADGGAPFAQSDFPFNRGLAIGADRSCYAGGYIWDRSTQLAMAAAAGLVWVTPVEMKHIRAGTKLDVGGEKLQVAAVSATQFQVTLAGAHGAGTWVSIQSTTSLAQAAAAGMDQWVSLASVDGLTVGNQADLGGERVQIIEIDPMGKRIRVNLIKAHAAMDPVRLVEYCVMRCDHKGQATIVSQNFSPSDPRHIAASPVEADRLYLVTDDNRLFTTDAARTAGPSTIWTEITGDVPRNPDAAALLVDGAKDVYLMLVGVPGGHSTPLFKLSGSAWIPQPMSGMPSARFGPLVADPERPGMLYAVANARVYRLTLASGTWTWSDLSGGAPSQGGLPKGVLIEALDAVPIGNGRVLLRASVFGRGVWEAEVTPNAVDAPISLYVRDNVLDQGWATPSPAGLTDPYQPPRVVTWYECIDVKFDLLQKGNLQTADFFQSDPEGALPLDFALFGQLRDRRKQLAPLASAMVHVQVHNRSHTPASGVMVWALYTNVPRKKAIPKLDERTSLASFDFWSQFALDGRIYPNLPGDSVWKAFGPPITLPDLDVHDPRVASWAWTVPAGFDPESYCVGVFVHSFDSPLVETSVNLSEVAPRQRQVGQVFVGQTLPGRIRVQHMASVIWKLLRGVRDGFAIFVDPLWDPIRRGSR